MANNWIHSLTYHGLDICYQMVQTSTNNSHQLTTCVDHFGVWPLIVMPVPLLRAPPHLGHVVRSQGQMLQMTMSSHRPRGNEVIQRQAIEGTEYTPRTLDSLENHLGRRISPPWIVVGNTSVLDVVTALEPLEALCPSIVDVLGIGDELRRRKRSIGGRHFVWRMG